jgi:hypothetical protein
VKAQGFSSWKRVGSGDLAAAAAHGIGFARLSASLACDPRPMWMRESTISDCPDNPGASRNGDNKKTEELS